MIKFRSIITASALALLLVAPSMADSQSDPLQPYSTVGGRTPLAFTENKGQWDDSVLFRTTSDGTTLWFTSSGVYHQWLRAIPNSSDCECSQEKQRDPAVWHACNEIEMLVVKKSLDGVMPGAKMIGEVQMEYKCNFLHGNDQSKWISNVPNYQQVILQNIYAGIDLRYYGAGTQMEYDFIVAPGSDYHQIQFSYENINYLTVLPNGNLSVVTDWGTLTEQVPLVYQELDGVRRTLHGSFVQLSYKSVAFTVDSYNPELALVIDPLLEFSTYLGGNDDAPWPYSPIGDAGHGVAADESGNVYVTGETWSTDFPKVNAFRTSSSEYRLWEGFVTKINLASHSLVYSTYLGGSFTDCANAIAVDGSGSAYITGETGSNDFPSINSVQAKNGYDIFVTKLTPDGTGIEYSSFLGGGPSGINGTEYGTCIAVDAAGRAVVSGQTTRANFPVVNAVQPTMPNDETHSDCFVAKFSAGGAPLIFSTYFGGEGDEKAHALALDGSGNIYVTGETDSHVWPTVNPFQAAMGSEGDAFLFKLTANGTSIVYSTYLGGLDYEVADGVGVDGTGHAYVAGTVGTGSDDFPTTTNAMFPTRPSIQSSDAFLTKFNPDGASVAFSTYFGAMSHDGCEGLGVDAAGFAYMWGASSSSDFPLVLPFNSTPGGYFVSKFRPSGSSLVYSTFIGGTGGQSTGGGLFQEGAMSIDKLGSVYFAGSTSSATFPMANPYDNTMGGVGDAFVLKVTCCAGVRGDVNMAGIVDLADLSSLVAYLTGAYELPCPEEADVNAAGIIDLTDLSALTSYLTNQGYVLPNCY